MLAKAVPVEVNFSPEDPKSLLLYKLLNLLNVDRLIDHLIETILDRIKAEVSLEVALFFSVTHGLSNAFERLWDNGASAYQNITYNVHASNRLDQYYSFCKNIYSTERVERPLSLVDAVFIGLNVTMMRPDSDLSEHLSFLSKVIKKGAENWDDLNLRSLLKQFQVSSEEPDSTPLCRGDEIYKVIVRHAFLPNIIKKITEFDYFFFKTVLCCDPHVAVLLLNTLFEYPEIKALLHKKFELELLYSDGTFSDLYGVHNVLHLAAAYSSIEVVKFLLDQGADLNVTTSNGLTALHIAMSAGFVCGYGSQEVIISDAADDRVLPPAPAGKTPGKIEREEAKYKRIQSRVPLVKFLIKNGADILASGNSGLRTFTPLECAVIELNAPAVKLMLKRLVKSSDFIIFSGFYSSIDGCIDSYCRFSRTESVDERFIEIMQLFLQLGFTRYVRLINLEKGYNKSLLLNNRPAIYYWLSGSANAGDEIIVGIRNGDKDKLASFLLSADDIDQEWCNEALVNAIVFGQTEIVSLLLNNGIGIHQRFHGATLLDLVDIKAEYGKELVKLLLKNGVFDNEDFKDFPFTKHFTKAELKEFKDAHKIAQSAKAAATSSLSTTVGSISSLPSVALEKTIAEDLRRAAEVSSAALCPVSLSVKKEISGKENEKYIADLIIDLKEASDFIRQYIDEAKIAEAKDALKSYESMIRKLEAYRDSGKKNRTLINQCSLFRNQLRRLAEQIEKKDLGIVGVKVKFPSKASSVCAAGAGAKDDSDRSDECSVVDDSISTVTVSVKKSDDAGSAEIDPALSGERMAQIDFLNRINAYAIARIECGAMADDAVHYNLIRLFELWSGISDLAAPVRHHLLHRYFDIASSDLNSLALTIASTDGFLLKEGELNKIIFETTYYQTHIKPAAIKYFTDNRNDGKIIAGDLKASLTALQALYDKFKAMSDNEINGFLESNPVVADAARMHIVKLGELLRCKEEDALISSLAHQYLMNHCKNKNLVKLFSGIVCQARNTACHINNFTVDRVTGRPIHQESLAPSLLVKTMRMASEINRELESPPAAVASVLRGRGEGASTAEACGCGAS